MSKTIIYGHDIDEYLKCPYRFIKSKKEGVDPSEYLSSDYVRDVLITEGINFEKKIFSEFYKNFTYNYNISVIPINRNVV